MMRTTAFPISIIAWMAASGKIPARGVQRQELAVDPDIFMNELKKRGINLERYDTDALDAEGITSRVLNFLSQQIGHQEYDFITAWEVVEHIPFECLEAVFANVHTALRPGGLFRFSTPDFDAPLCQAYDFFNACPPFHLTVLSSFWLRNYFAQRPAWKLIEMKSNSDFLDDAVNWFEYGKKNCPEFQLRGLSAFLKRIFQSPHANELIRELLADGMGTEVVVTVQKQ